MQLRPRDGVCAVTHRGRCPGGVAKTAAPEREYDKDTRSPDLDALDALALRRVATHS